MLEALTARLMSGLITLSFLLSPNLTGNSPTLHFQNCLPGRQYIQVSAVLQRAFEHDFEAVFKSGRQVHIWFSVTVTQNDQQLYSKDYRHSLQFEPMNSAWKVYHSESSDTRFLTDYAALVEDISHLQCSIPVQSHWKVVLVRISAHLSEIELPQAQRRVDLNLFWKNSRPSALQTVDLRLLQ